MPFSAIVSDAWGWYYLNGSTPTVRPTKNQTVRFKVNLAVASCPATTILLQLFKNGSALVNMAAIVVGTAGDALVLSGEAFDVPNGSTDTYYVVITTGSAVVVDTTNSWLTAEVVGN